MFLLRVLEIKCFKNEISSCDLVNFIRDLRVVDKGDGTYINISQNQSVNEKIKNLTGLTNLDALYLTEKEIANIFEFAMLIDSWVLGFERNDGSQIVFNLIPRVNCHFIQ